MIYRPTKVDKRYPFTYACDWIRMMGYADSRSDATKFYNGYEDACHFADSYLMYWSLMADAEDVLDRSREEMEIYG